jgi:putative sterol carrier protein
MQDEGPGAPGTSAQGAVPGSQSDDATQPTIPDNLSEGSAGAPPPPNQGVYQDVLVQCNALVERYRKGEVSKATVYVDIQSKLIKAFGNDRDRSDAAFGSFIATIESHDSEVEMAARRAAAAGTRQRSSSPPVSDADEQQSDGEPVSKKPKLDESEYAWMAERKGRPISLSKNLTKTLKLLDVYTVDPKAAKRSLTNQPDCPEFPDSEWKNVISGRAVNLDAVLSGQLSTTNDELKVEKFGDIEVSFGAVEPTKVVKNGGDWSIAWNRTVRAIVFAFPHRIHELTGYGEYIINLFSVTHPTVHGRVIAFDRAAQKCVGSVRNLELSDFEKFADLKIAHMDSIGVAVSSGPSKPNTGREKGAKRGKNWKKDEACNKWNDGMCNQEEEDCRRKHVCNKCGRSGHKGKECRKTA